MPRSKKAESGGKKKKPVTLAFVKPEASSVPHQIIERMIDEHYPHLESKSIAVFWKYGWKAENDTGMVRLWATKKASETIRCLTKFDLCIYLNGDLWGKKGFTNEHADFIVDSALCEIAQDLDRDGEQKQDESNRDCWRILKPTIQTFPQIVERHGFVTVELQRLAQAAHKADIEARPLFAELEADGPEADSGVSQEAAAA